MRGHLDGAMGSLTAPQRDVAADVFGYLVTPSGAKIRYSAEDLASYARRTPDEVAGVLNALSHPELRIIRRVPAPSGDPDGQGFEIFHDVLAGAVRGWAQRTRAARLERRNARLAAAVATLAAIAVALLVQGADSGALHRLELRTVDERFALRGGHAPDPRILIVGFDDRANERELTRAADAAVLAKVAAGRPAVAVVAFEYDAAGDDGNGGPAETQQLKRAIGDANKLTRVLLGTSRVDNEGATTLFGSSAARTKFEGAQAAYGDFPLDDDRAVRRVEFEGRLPGAFAKKGLRTLAVQAAEKSGNRVAQGDVPQRGAWIDFAGGGGSYPRVSFLDVLEDRVDPARFRNRIVVIGDTLTDLVDDSLPTAVDREGRMAPVEWHANAIATLRAGQPLRDVPTALTVALIVGLALLASALAMRCSMLTAFALSAGAGLLCLLAAQLAFNAGWVVAVVPSLLALGLATVANPLVARAARIGGRGASAPTLCPVSTTETARAWLAGPDEAEAVAELLVAFRDHMGVGLAVGECLPGLGRAADGGPRHGLPARRARRRRAGSRRAAAALSLQRLEGGAGCVDRGRLRRCPARAARASATRWSPARSSGPPSAAHGASSWTATRRTPARSRCTSATGSRRARRAARHATCSSGARSIEPGVCRIARAEREVFDTPAPSPRPRPRPARAPTAVARPAAASSASRRRAAAAPRPRTAR